MSFRQWVSTYRDKLNPATKMYWNVKDIPGDQKLNAIYLSFAQDANLKHVTQYRTPASDQDLIDAWEAFSDKIAAEAWVNSKH